MRRRLLLQYKFIILIGAVGLPTLLVLLQNIQWYEILVLSVTYSSLIVAGGVGIIFVLRRERFEKQKSTV
ncbi:MAG: hypothetical protein RMJ14_02335 [Nitrososphaerota archaeon]|nr:hypothetical protein [Aigarchaeota archaeon]MDW8076462.1 hypothetical protein [Nitrososphaerota archaeon]